MVEDLKGYRDRKPKKPPSPGWSILILSHMAILVVGMSLGYWIGGRFATVSTVEQTVSRRVDSTKDDSLESVAEPEKGGEKEDIGGDDTEKESLPAPNQPEEKPRYTFYETLPKEIIPDAETAAKQEGKGEAGGADPENSPERPATENRPRQLTRELPPVAYYVQVASFRERERAAKLRDELMGKGYSAGVMRKDLKEKGVWYRVRLGPFDDKASANQEAQTVAEREDFQPIIVLETNEKRP